MTGQDDPKAGDARRGRQPDAAKDAAHAYSKLHRALLPGLPTQLGMRGDKGLYDGPRGRKFQFRIKIERDSGFAYWGGYSRTARVRVR